MEANSFQLIDDELGWRPNLTDYLSKRIGEVHTSNYKSIAIIGAQSTGKSALANHLFGTNFQVMDSKVKRTQTTRGIFVQPVEGNPTASTFLIFDVEGTDSESRQDYGSRFEKILCTFALVVADVLIVNMFTTDVGRNKGSSMQLLKTILQINVKLFKNEIRPKKVIITLRDFSQDENIEEIERKFHNALQDFLKDIETSTKVVLKDVIEYKLSTLPHYTFQREAFDQRVKEIKKEFIEGEIFPKGKSSVPLNGLEKYLQSIWEKIKSDETLDIPNEQVLVSIYLCDKAINQVLDEMENDLSSLGNECTERLLGKKFLERCSQLNREALDLFKERTMYLEPTYSDQGIGRLTDSLKMRFQEFSSIQIEVLSQAIESDLEQAMRELQNFSTLEDFLNYCQQLKDFYVTRFKKKSAFYQLDGESVHDSEIQQISNRIDNLQRPLIEKYMKEFEQTREEEHQKEIQRREEENMRQKELEEEKRREDQERREEEHQQEIQRKEEEIKKLRELNTSQQYTQPMSFPQACGGGGMPFQYVTAGPDFGGVSDISANEYLAAMLGGVMDNSCSGKVADNPGFSPSGGGVVHLTQAGLPDMRFSENREALITPDGVHHNMDGSLDMRYAENRDH